MTNARRYHAASILTDRKVLVTGRRNGPSNYLSSAKVTNYYKQIITKRSAVDYWTSRSGNCSTLWRNGSPHEKSYILRRNG